MGVCFEGWTLLAGLARETHNVRLGLLVTGITHRHPAVLFKEVVTVDHLSGGRLIFGAGAAWNVREHAAYGLPYPPDRDRVDLFGEAMELYRLLETQERTTYSGKFLTLDNAPFEPKPVNGRVPILVGSVGPRMMRHIARYADQWDGGGSPEEFAAHGARLNAICEEVGRDPAEIRWACSAGRDLWSSEADFRRHVAAYAAIGVRSFIFGMPRGAPTATMQHIAGQVVPDLRARFRDGQPLE
jgi:alkanesulfonate monooxygenase SsuD/methylene tetrahydromethanopterin reductase-like flavin-dependent oxidoreductase (luciferase family)